MARPGTVVVADAGEKTVQEELALEYLSAVLQPLTYYSLDHGDAQPALKCFHVVKMHAGRKKARAMKCCEFDRPFSRFQGRAVNPASLYLESSGRRGLHCLCRRGTLLVEHERPWNLRLR